MTKIVNSGKKQTSFFSILAGSLLLLFIACLTACSSSDSKTRTQVKNATSGPYDIHAQIIAPTDGSTVFIRYPYSEDDKGKRKYGEPESDTLFVSTATGGTEPYGFTWTAINSDGTETTSSKSGGDSISIWFRGRTDRYRIRLQVTDAKGIVGTDEIRVKLAVTEYLK